MDDLTAYYAPPIHHPYYQPTPPPGTVHAPHAAVVQPIHEQPQIVAYAPQTYAQSSQDQLRTLFVAGLPEDVKPREIYHLFREFPGYQSSNLRPPTSSNSQPFAFATFVDQQSAIMALHALNGLVFDLEKGSTLYIDLAKSNSRSKRSRADDDRPVSEKRLKGSSSVTRSFEPGGGSIHITGMGNSAHTTIGYPSTQRMDALAESLGLVEALAPCPIPEDRVFCLPVDNNNNVPNIFPIKSGNADGASVNFAPSKSNNTPCPTLFVANLGPTSSEEELTQVFSRCRGFLKLKMQSTYGAPVAFVDFQDTPSSTEALSHLQGTILYLSTSGEGMRLEYARSRMGLRSKKSR